MGSNSSVTAIINISDFISVFSEVTQCLIHLRYCDGQYLEYTLDVKTLASI